MRIVTIAAGHQAFVNFVMEGLGEGRFGIRVAGVAELWLSLNEEMFVCDGFVNAVATQAVNVPLPVR